MHDWHLQDPFLRSWIVLGQAWEAMNRAVELELGQHQMTGPQFGILLLLASATKPLSPGEIASYVFREKHTVSTLISRMEKAGYVEKARCTDDSRVVKVRIKPKGQALLGKVKGGALGYSHNLLSSCFTAEEAELWGNQLRKLRDTALRELGQEIEAVPPIFQATGLIYDVPIKKGQ